VSPNTYLNSPSKLTGSLFINCCLFEPETLLASKMHKFIDGT
jgi:hypothetical protein